MKQSLSGNATNWAFVGTDEPLCTPHVFLIDNASTWTFVRSDAAHHNPPRRFHPRDERLASDTTASSRSPCSSHARLTRIRPACRVAHYRAAIHRRTPIRRACVGSALPISCSLSRVQSYKECLLILFPKDALSQPPLPMAAGRTCQSASGHPWLSQWHPRARPNASGVRASRLSPPAPTLATEIDQPRPPPLCCKCVFHVFQLFQMYVTIVSYGCC